MLAAWGKWNVRKIAFLLGTTVLSVACGGGGGSEPSAPTTPAPPPVTAIDPATVQFEKHLSFKQRITTVFPENWERQGEGNFENADVLASFAAPLENEQDQFRENVLLLKFDKNEELVSSSTEGYQEVSRSTINIAGVEGEELIFDAVVPEAREKNFRFMAMSFVLNDSQYALLYTSERSEFDRFREVVRYMGGQMSAGLVLFDGLDLSSDLSNPGRPAVASDGQSFLVITCMASGSATTGHSLVGRFVNADWSMQPPLIIQPFVNDCALAAPRLLFDGNNYMVVYRHDTAYGSKIYGKRISDSGVILDTLPIKISQNATTTVISPEMSFDGSRTLVVWSETLNDYSIRGNFISADGTAGSPFTIEENLDSKFSGVYSYNYAPKIAYGDNRYLVAWTPNFFMDGPSAAPRSIDYQMLDLQGNLLLVDPAPTPSPNTVREDTGVNPRYAQVVFIDDDFYISWIEGSLVEENLQQPVYEVRTRLVSPLGDLQGDSQLVAAHQTSVNTERDFTKDFLKTIHHDGYHYFLWATTSYTPEMGVWGTKIDTQSAQISDPEPIVATRGDTPEQFMNRPAEPNVAFSDTHAFYVWSSRDGVIEAWFKPLE